MKIISGKIYPLRIPFVEAFAHSTKERKFSDSFVVRLVADDGTEGFGEGAARPYVTGETVETSVEYIKKRFFPAIREKFYAEIETGIDALDALAPVAESLPAPDLSDEIIYNAARAAVETALIDCFLKCQKRSLGAILPPKCEFVTYSGVITAGTIERAIQHAMRFKFFAVKQLKIKIGDKESVSRVAAIRQSVGEDVSLRVDANGAYSVESAIEISNLLAPYKIDSIEQPIPRGNVKDLAKVKNLSPIPVMVDESLVTLTDAEKLIEASACDFFNLRISKCGGIFNTIKIAQMAKQAKIRLQIGCQVGETAILSAAGRHLAAYLEDVEFVEGSFGTLLLAEDISRNSINFGHGGRAPLLRGTGLGIEVREEILAKYVHRAINLGKELSKYA
jgi:L-Ala-D/L-Glu epimerase